MKRGFILSIELIKRIVLLMIVDKIALNVSEVADALGVSRPVVYQLMKRADFPAFKIGRRTLVSKNALEEWVDKQWVQEKTKYSL